MIELLYNFLFGQDATLPPTMALNMKIKLFVLLLICLTHFSVSAELVTPTYVLDALEAKAKQQGTIRVIISLGNDSVASDSNEILKQKSDRERTEFYASFEAYLRDKGTSLAKRSHTHKISNYSLIPSIAITVTFEELNAIRKISNVRGVTEDFPLN